LEHVLNSVMNPPTNPPPHTHARLGEVRSVTKFTWCKIS